MDGEEKAEGGVHARKKRTAREGRLRFRLFAFFLFLRLLSCPDAARVPQMSGTRICRFFLFLASVLRTAACLRTARLAAGGFLHKGSRSASVRVCWGVLCGRVSEHVGGSTAVVAQRHMRRSINGWALCRRWRMQGRKNVHTTEKADDYQRQW